MAFRRKSRGTSFRNRSASSRRSTGARSRGASRRRSPAKRAAPQTIRIVIENPQPQPAPFSGQQLPEMVGNITTLSAGRKARF